MRFHPKIGCFLENWRTAVLILFLLCDAQAILRVSGGTVIYDLGSSWNDSFNPNGVWSYNEGTNPLPHVPAWESSLGSFSSSQPGWARSENGTNHVPVWFRSVAAPRFAADWQIGDIIVHSTDDSNGRGQGNANITWTSPMAGQVDIVGAIWMTRDISRGNHWKLYVNNNPITGGDVFSGDAYNRETPFLFSLGSGGGKVLTNIFVALSDVIKLEVTRASLAGDFAGVKLSIKMTVPGPVLGVDMYAGIRLEGKVGVPYRIEYLNSVAGPETWVPLTNFVLPASPFLFIDLDSTNSNRRFYRAVEAPGQ